jgi:glycosyltransferase involved in cell wall biosynthesis
MVEIVFWLSVALVLYAYLGYPACLAILGRLRTRPVRTGEVTPRVSLVITAHNEEARIREKLENALGQEYPADRLEIIVASDCSTDGTDAIVGSYRARGVRLVRSPERRGKEAAQALAVEAATGEILVFSDVATALRPDGVSRIVRSFADPTVGCVSSIDRFVDPDGRVSGEGAYVRYEMRLRALETRVNGLVGLSGSFFAARRRICQPWATDRQSDFNTLLNAVERGFRGVQDVESVGYYRNIADDRREFQRKVRTVVRGLGVLVSRPGMLNPFRHGLFAWQLASHKLCRWLVPFGMIGAGLGAALLARRSTVYLLALAGQLGFYALAAAGIATRARALRIPSFLVLVNLAILAAWCRYARGDRMTTWSPSERLAGLPQPSANR